MIDEEIAFAREDEKLPLRGTYEGKGKEYEARAVVLLFDGGPTSLPDHTELFIRFMVDKLFWAK